jgi:hypothetical protein
MSQSISRIEQILVYHGASNVMKEYGPQGELDTLSFVMMVDGHKWFFKLPARVNEIEKALVMKIKRPKKESLAKARQQAERTAWKLQLELLEIEMTLIELRQRTVMEVFLSCIYDPSKRRTFYESLVETKFKGLIAIPEKT